MKNNRISHGLLVMFMVGIMVFTAGCAVLTSSQVAEVKKFAKASEDYSGLPGELAQSYGILLRNHKLLSLSRYQYGTKDEKGGIKTEASIDAWDKIQEAYDLEIQFSEEGKRMDKALEILKNYSKLLTLLVSDEYTEALGKSAEKLGNSLDKAVDAYNKEYRPDNPMKSMGTEVAKLVRAVGGIYIRHRQYEILKETVSKSDALIESLMDEVETIALQKMKPAFENYEKNYLSTEFKSVVNYSGHIEYPTSLAIYENLKKTRSSAELAVKIGKAAKSYKAAHSQLAKNIQVRMDLKQAIEEIDALKNEVEAANKIKKKAEK